VRRGWWRWVAAAGVVLATACAPAGGRSAEPLTGKITWPKDGDLWVYDLVSKQSTRITSLPRGAAVTGATWSPDGKRVVYSQFWRRPNENMSGADLFVANADGSEAKPFVERDAPSTVLDTPEWAPAGRVYYTTRRVQSGRESQVIVRQAEAGTPESLVENAYNPGVAPDETSLLYVRPTRAGQALWKKTLGQPGDGCELLSDSVFQILGLPRVSPDGKTIAIGASGEPSLSPGPNGCGGQPAAVPKASGDVSPMLLLAEWLGPATALAHGLPWDIWTMGIDGSGLVRVAELKEDEPTVAWSPDGTRLTVFGVAALYLVDAKPGGQVQKLVDQGAYGALDWSR
jgi:Tol biopolymer transport system component